MWVLTNSVYKTSPKTSTPGDPGSSRVRLFIRAFIHSFICSFIPSITPLLIAAQRALGAGSRVRNGSLTKLLPHGETDDRWINKQVMPRWQKWRGWGRPWGHLWDSIQSGSRPPTVTFAQSSFPKAHFHLGGHISWATTPWKRAPHVTRT